MQEAAIASSVHPPVQCVLAYSVCNTVAKMMPIASKNYLVRRWQHKCRTYAILILAHTIKWRCLENADGLLAQETNSLCYERAACVSPKVLLLRVNWRCVSLGSSKPGGSGDDCKMPQNVHSLPDIVHNLDTLHKLGQRGSGRQSRDRKRIGRLLHNHHFSGCCEIFCR